MNDWGGAGMVADEGRRLVAKWIEEGWNKKRIAVITVHRIRDGRFAKTWTKIDFAGPVDQLTS
jgi:hypothetical protein